MLKLIRYFRPYLLSAVGILALLFLQANMELALPDLMSRIVNVGIQQGGIESPLPEVIRASEMEKIKLLSSVEERASLEKAYSRMTPAEASAEEIETWPILATQAIYLLDYDPYNEDLQAGLLAFLPRSVAMLSMLENAASGNLPETAVDSGASSPLAALPPGTDPFELMGQLPEEQKAVMLSQLTETFGKIDAVVTEQMAIAYVSSENSAIGLDPAAIQSLYILNTGGIMILYTLISVLAAISVSLLAARAAAGVAQSLRSDVFQKVESFSGAEFDRFSTASLITRSTNDITQIQQVTFMIFRMVIYAPILGIGGVVRALSKAPSMAWIIAIAVAVLLMLVLIVFSIAMPRFKKIQKLTDRLNLVVRENLSGLLVVRAFNRQPFEEKRFDKANQDLTDTNRFIARVMVTMMPVMMLIMNLLSVGIVWIGAEQIAASTLQVGDMMAFMQYAMQIVMAFLMLSMMFIMLPRASVSGARVAEVLDTEPVIQDSENALNLKTASRGLLEFRNVCFRYPGADTNALCGINFTAEPGKTTAIIGATGSGKSTIANLIPRFYDISEGEILLDGEDIRGLTQHSLRKQIGYIPQKVTLFSGTVNSNLRYADEQASDEQIREAAETAQAAEFISGMEDGFEAPIAQSGTNISGGQKQRLSIARALLKNSPIQIFDDSFSALDFKTDATLRRAMAEKKQQKTQIIIAQRVSTIMTAEQILVLDEGRIVGKGTHDQLMENCPTYREIAVSQLELEENA